MDTSWIISGVFIFLLIVAAVWYQIKCRAKISAVNSDIEKVLVDSDLAEALKNSESLAPAWKNFEKSLTKVDDKFYSTIDAAEFFNPQNLTRGMNMTFWQNYGGIFTGLGILGTFAGLTFGLRGVDMTSGDIETLKSSIAQLLSGVESAFVTSLAGIACAIFYSVIHHGLLVKFQKNVQSLADKLDEKFPRRSAENWLVDIKGETQNQTAELQNIGGQVATENSWLEKNYTETQKQTAELQTVSTDIKNIGEDVAQAIYNGIDEKLGTYVDKICAAIENLGESGNNKLGEIISDRVGSQMDRFSAALDRFSDNIDEKLNTANRISKLMNEQLLNTLKDLDKTLKQNAQTSADERNTEHQKFSDALAGLSKTLQDLAENSKNQYERQQKNLEDTAHNHATQISEAVKAFRAIVDAHNATTKEIFAQVQSQLKETKNFLEQVNSAGTSLKQAAEPVKQSTLLLTKNLSETSAQMKNLSAANQITRQNLSDLTTKLKDFTDNFNGIAKELETSTNTIKNSLENYNSKMNDGMTKNLNNFDKRITDAVGHLQSLVQDLSGVLEDFNRKRR